MPFAARGAGGSRRRQLQETDTLRKHRNHTGAPSKTRDEPGGAAEGPHGPAAPGAAAPGAAGTPLGPLKPAAHDSSEFILAQYFCLHTMQLPSRLAATPGPCPSPWLSRGMALETDRGHRRAAAQREPRSEPSPPLLEGPYHRPLAPGEEPQGSQAAAPAGGPAPPSPGPLSRPHRDLCALRGPWSRRCPPARPDLARSPAAMRGARPPSAPQHRPLGPAPGRLPTTPAPLPPARRVPAAGCRRPRPSTPPGSASRRRPRCSRGYRPPTCRRAPAAAAGPRAGEAGGGRRSAPASRGRTERRAGTASHRHADRHKDTPPLPRGLYGLRRGAAAPAGGGGGGSGVE